MKREDFNEERVWERILARGLIVECPYRVPLVDCPLKEVRKIPLEERINIVNEMSGEDLDVVLAHHSSCQRARSLAEGKRG